MDFELTEDQKGIVDAAYEYGVRRLAPYYQERQNTGVFDRETLKEMGAMGFFGVELPERLGELLSCEHEPFLFRGYLFCGKADLRSMRVRMRSPIG